VSSGDLRPPFPQAEASWAAQWSPDGSMLAAYVVMGGPACLGVLHLADRRLSLMRDAAVRPFFGFELPSWSQESRLVVVKLWQRKREMSGESNADDRGSGVVAFLLAATAKLDDRVPVLLISDRYGCDFETADVRTQEVHRLAENLGIIGGWRLSPNGTLVAVPVIAGEDPALQQFIGDLVVVPLDATEIRAVARGVIFDYGQSFGWLPDCLRIAFTTSGSPSATGRRSAIRLVVADVTSQRQPLDLSANIGDDLREAHEHSRWSDAGDLDSCIVPERVGSLRTHGSAARKTDVGDGKFLTSWIHPPDYQVMRATADGALPLLLRDSTSQAPEVASVECDCGGSVTRTALRKHYVARGETLSMEVEWSKQTAYLHLEAVEHPTEIWRLDLTTADARRLASLNPGLQDHRPGSKRLVGFLDADGLRRHPSLLLSPDYIEGRQVPMLVKVYGGTVGSQRIYSFGLRDCLGRADAYRSASHGYALLLSDVPPGPRDPRRGIPRSVLPAVNRVSELGIADP